MILSELKWKSVIYSVLDQKVYYPTALGLLKKNLSPDYHPEKSKCEFLQQDQHSEFQDPNTTKLKTKI